MIFLDGFIVVVLENVVLLHFVKQLIEKPINF